jgi:uncharacterized protein (UPF0332 family)
MNKERDALVAYRLGQAEEALESARILLDHEKFPSSVSRSYYAMFYAVLALLARENHRVSKHSAAIAVFNREFVKKGIFDKDLSRWLQEAFDLRQRSDYREMFSVTGERAGSVLERAGSFLEKIKKQINLTLP